MTVFLCALALLLIPATAGATHYLDIRVVDKDYLMLHFRDGEVHYRDDGTGPSAYLGHSFAEGDDTLLVFHPRLDAEAAGSVADWTVRSADDRAFGSVRPVAVHRKSKPMNTDHTLSSELDHWIFLRLPRPMQQGCSYTVDIPAGLGSDVRTAGITFNYWRQPSEAVHVNLLGYSPQEAVQTADLKSWWWCSGGGASGVMRVEPHREGRL